MRRTAIALLVLSFVAASGARAQTDSTVQRAQELFDGFDFPRALVAGRAALEHNLNDEDRATAYAVVGFSLGALDSTGQAVQALQQFILLDPDRVPDTDVLGPRLVDLYNDHNCCAPRPTPCHHSLTPKSDIRQRRLRPTGFWRGS